MHSHVDVTFEYLLPYILDVARIVTIVALAWIFSRASRKAVGHLRAHTVGKVQRGGASEVETQKRVDTMTRVTARALGTVIWTAAFVMVLHELRFNVEPLIAGAGLVGVAIGFGAQSLIKDVLNGMFLLIENQLRINDVAIINGTGGLVEEINLRTTVLRGENGAVHVFPNGSITQLSNLTRDFSYAVFNVTVEYSQNLNRVMKVVNELGVELRNEEPWSQMILDPLEMLGVDSLSDSGAVIKFRFRTAPMKQWTIAREMNLRLKSRFEETGIELAFPAQTVHLASESSAMLREELRAVVREVLAERKESPDGGGAAPISPRPEN
jgi:small-conductance mechanosensitive channel